jgi:raffinose/stachyose/melibiose transport system permease protein
VTSVPTTASAPGSRPLGTTWLLVGSFLLPALLVYSVFVIWPMVQSVILSFYRWDGFAPQREWRGLGNYAYVLQDPVFWRAAGNTVFLMVFEFLTVVPIALGLAVLLAEKMPLVATFRMMFFLPFVLAEVTTGLIWRYLLDGNYGLLSDVTAFGLDEAFVLADRQLALYAVATVMTWKNFGFHMILFIAALQQIDRSLYEAADIDGATAFAKFRLITVPLILPTIAVSGFLIVVASLQAFDVVWSLTGGGPSGATATLVSYLYEDGIASFRMGFGAAVGVVVFGLTLAVAAVYRGFTGWRR